MTYVIQTLQGARRVTEAEGGKILTFPLHSPLLMPLSLVVESIISCFGKTFRAPHHLGGYIELLPFATLRIQSKRLGTG